MIFDFLFVAIAFYLAIPGVAGYCARSYGRPFWKWFFIGMFFPIVTHFILYILIERDIRQKKLIAFLKAEEITYMEDQINELADGKISLSEPRNKDNFNKLIKE
ncbi:MAG: hypothetical protein WBA74_13720 [Cyclobacteriaceae bacterium]